MSKRSVALDAHTEDRLEEIRKKLEYRLGTGNRSLLLRFAVDRLSRLPSAQLLEALDSYMLDRGSEQLAG